MKTSEWPQHDALVAWAYIAGAPVRPPPPAASVDAKTFDCRVIEAVKRAVADGQLERPIF